jgi:catechol 2,3-dioxygenase-like lactoylglutathione lyase family enzyme
MMEVPMPDQTLPKVLKAHVSLTVSNLANSIDFYRKMLGIEPFKAKPGYAKFDVENPPLNLSLLEAGRKGKGTLSHLGLQVASTDDVVTIRNRWAAAGLQPRDEMQSSCCYALQDKAWVHDPDGNEWEVFTVLKDIESAETSCCSDGSICCTAASAEDLVNITTGS